jgi:hypothetical protein
MMQRNTVWKATRPGCKWIAVAALLWGASGCENITGIKDFTTQSPARSDASADGSSEASAGGGDGSDEGADGAVGSDDATDGADAPQE